MAVRNEIVVVTGSSGFVGQHLVKLLHEHDDHCSEIRLFDLKPYENKIGHREKKPVKHFIGDIRDAAAVSEAFKGANCVIHAAAVVDLKSSKNVNEMVTTNVDGTETVIDACIRQNIPRLVFCSTTDVVCGTEHIFYGTESTTPIPSTFMIGTYGQTKCKAERLVLKANGQLLANGDGTLRTVSVRPTPLYGPQDQCFFYEILRYAKKHKYYLRIRSLDERLQISFVGNAAWALIKAKDRLAVDETISGESFFITDDTAIIDIHEHIRPFLEVRNIPCLRSTLNSRRAASPLVRLVEGEERWEAPDHPQGVLSLNWDETELNRSVTCMVLKALANDRCHLALCHDEFRGP
ncbi:hypothetical protein TNCV_4652761 [Trichonephila clavipes]|nr:hypothetical protein TNCV_4652761 [Trichonephila clavipes]